MDKGIEIALDTKAFTLALSDYLKYTSKDFDEAVGSKMRDAFLRASRAAKKAKASAIRRKYTPRYIATALRKSKHHFYHSTGDERGDAAHDYRIKRRYSYVGRDGKMRRKTAWTWYSRKEARIYWRALWKRAGRAVGFIRAFLVGAAVKTAVRVGVPIKGGKGLAGDSTFGVSVKWNSKAEKGDKAMLDVAAFYDYRKKQGKTAIPNMILLEAMRKGFAETVADMRHYIEKKMAKQSEKYSASGVA